MINKAQMSHPHHRDTQTEFKRDFIVWKAGHLLFNCNILQLLVNCNILQLLVRKKINPSDKGGRSY